MIERVMKPKIHEIHIMDRSFRQNDINWMHNYWLGTMTENIASPKTSREFFFQRTYKIDHKTNFLGSSWA